MKSKGEITAIVGLGYVGLPLMLDFCEAGQKVLGLDIDGEKIEQLQAGESYISYIPGRVIKGFFDAGMMEVSMDFRRLREAHNVLITVPTPLDEHREPDLQFVRHTGTVIAANLRSGQLVVLESTTYPGTTREVLLPILGQGDLRAGHDFYLAYSPERVDPNRADYSARKIPKVVGGLTAACLERVSKLYGKVFETVVPVSSLEVAEASKLLENIFRSVNIALVNEMKTLFDRMEIDVWEVIRASSTKPFGFMPFYPGPGLGGHCIPVDPFYLTWKAREYDFATRFIELAGEINSQMPYYVVERTMAALNEQGKSMKGARVLVLGAAYKKDVNDIRESPAVKIITLLAGRGADVSYHDPHIPLIEGMRKYPELKMEAVELKTELLEKQDCLLVVTDHSCYDYQWLWEHSALIVDTRNVYPSGRVKVIKA